MHIFALSDNLPIPKTGVGLTYIGRISLQEHMSARQLWAKADAIGVLIHPFEDTRLSQEQVNQLLALSKQNHANKELTRMLENILSHKSGLISFVD